MECPLMNVNDTYANISCYQASYMSIHIFLYMYFAYIIQKRLIRFGLVEYTCILLNKKAKRLLE